MISLGNALLGAPISAFHLRAQEQRFSGCIPAIAAERRLPQIERGRHHRKREGIEAMWQIAHNGWIYIVRDPERAGKSLVTILVANLEKHAAEISSRGIGDWKTENLPGVYRKAIFTDADGNTITFAQALHDGK